MAATVQPIVRWMPEHPDIWHCARVDHEPVRYVGRGLVDLIPEVDPDALFHHEISNPPGALVYINWSEAIRRLPRHRNNIRMIQRD